jgi:HYR domain
LISIANFLHDLKYRLAYITNISIVNSNTTKNERDILSTDVLKLSSPGTAIFIAAILVVSGSNIRSAFADNIVHSVDDSVSDGTVTLALGQTSYQVGYKLMATAVGSGKVGCGVPATFTINAGGLVPSQPHVTFSQCSIGAFTQSVTYTAPGPGTYSVSLAYFSGPAGVPPSKYNVLTSQLAIIVPNPQLSANNAPQLQLPRNIGPVEGNTQGGATVTYIVSTVDSEYKPYSTPRCSPESGSTFPLGTTTVNCQITDLGGLSDHGSFIVTVVDTKPPEWQANLQLNNIVVVKTVQPTVQVPYTTPRGTDVVDGPIDATCTPTSGGSFRIGQISTVSCILKDSIGNQNPEIKSFTVQEKRKIGMEEQPQENSIISLRCHPSEINIAQGTKGSLNCSIQNKSLKAVELILGCSGLSGTGIECLINGENSQTGTILVEQLSDKNFPLLIVSRSSPQVPVGSYPFTISAVCATTDNVSC